MLDAYIIDAIRQAELDREREFQRRRVYLELPLPSRRPEPRREETDMSDPIVIPLNPDREDEVEDDAA
jgi:hypothetical protein